MCRIYAVFTASAARQICADSNWQYVAGRLIFCLVGIKPACIPADGHCYRRCFDGSCDMCGTGIICDQPARISYYFYIFQNICPANQRNNTVRLDHSCHDLSKFISLRFNADGNAFYIRVFFKNIVDNRCKFLFIPVLERCISACTYTKIIFTSFF